MKLLLSGALLLWSWSLVVAEVPPVPGELEELTRVVMEGTSNPNAVLSRASKLDRVITAEPDPATRKLYEAMRHFLVGFAILGAGAQNDAEARFELAVEYAEHANELRPTSEGFRVLADAHNQLLNIRGTAYKAFNARRAREAADRAVELDPANPLAHLTAAGYAVSAPPIAGGSTTRGETHLTAARALAGESEYVGFLVAVWEGRLAAKLGEAERARAALERAHAIYPRNWWLAETAAELGIVGLSTDPRSQ